MCRPRVPSIPGLYETVVYARVQRGKRRWTRRLTVLASVSSLILGIILWQCLPPSALDSTANQISKLKDRASVVRLIAIAAFFLAWPFVICLASRNIEPSASHIRGARYRVCGWLLVIELVIGQNLLGRALG